MNEKTPTKIFELRKLGYSYKRISLETGYSKSTICYHLSTNQKIKNYTRTVKRRLNNSPLKNRIERFKSYPFKSVQVIPVNKEYRTPETWVRTRLTFKISKFQCSTLSSKTNKNRLPNNMHTFTSEDLILKSNSKCYLTGRDINFIQNRTYELDHIVPRALGGTNDLENCGVACTDANRAKAHMSLETFFQLCVDVVKHNNLKID